MDLQTSADEICGYYYCEWIWKTATTKYVEIATASGVEKPRRRNKLILLQRVDWKNSDDERCGYHYHDGRPASAAYAVVNDVKTPLGGARMMLASKSETTK